MTDRELTPAEEERVRRLLAGARHDAPMPAEVAARLDAVLRDLADQREGTPGGVTERPAARPAVEHRAPVVDLAARRRRRRATSFLVAAAAVTVIGVGVPQILGDVTISSSDVAASRDSDSGDSGGESAPQAGRDGTGGDNLEGYALKGGRLSVDRFDEEVSELRSGMRTTAPQDAPTPALSDLPEVNSGAASVCRPGVRQDAWGEGDLLWVRYDGRRGVLVFRAPEGDTQQVDLFLCRETEPTRSTVVPVP